MISWFVYTLAFLVVIVQTPLLVDLLRVVFPAWNIKRITNKTASVLLIIIIFTFALTGLWLQMFYFIPLFPDVSFRSMKIACHSVFAYWIWVNMVVNYWYAISTHPGSVDKALRNNPLLERDVYQSAQTEHLSNVTVHEEKPCDNVEKLKGKHRYCKECGVTMLYMDHHCPFTGNCVGLHTYSYFFLFLVYASLGVGYSLVISAFYFGQCLLPSVWNWLELEPLNDEICALGESFVHLYLPAVGGYIALEVALRFHIFLLLSDMTTSEVLTSIGKVPIFKICLERILNGVYSKKKSRLNVLLLSRRKNFLWYLLPVKNSQGL